MGAPMNTSALTWSTSHAASTRRISAQEHPIRCSTSILLALVLPIIWIVRLSIPAYAQARPQSPQEGKYILFLNSFEPSAPAVMEIDEGLSVALESGGIPGVNQFFESLDFRRNPGPEHRKFQIEQMRIRYGHRKIDMIITMYPEALEFVLNDCRDLFADVPILALYLPPSFKLPESSRRIIRHSPYYDIAGTFEIALRLMPQAKRVYIVSGLHEVDKGGEDQARRDLVKWEGRLEFHYLSRLSFEEILATLSTVPAGSVVLLLNFTQDTAGRFYLAPNLTERLNQVSAVPIFGLIGTALDHGIVGGNLIDFKLIGNRAGDIVLAHVKGTPLSKNVSQVLHVPSVPMFDWRQLRKWKLSESALPKNSIVINRQTTLWDFKYYIVGGLVFCLAQSFLIAGLLLQNRARREAETRFRSVLDGSRDVIYRLNYQTGRYEYISPSVQTLVGFSQDELMALDGETVFGRIHPDDQPAVQAAIAHLEETGVADVEYRHRVKSGDYRWLSNHMSLIKDGAGRPLYRDGNIRDITEHKELEQSVYERTDQLRALAGKLTLSERRERGRLAKILHDHIQQLLVGAKFPLSALEEYNDPVIQHIKTRVEQLLDESIRAARSLTAELSPPILHEGNLKAVMEWLARTMSDKYGLVVDLSIETHIPPLAEAVKVFLFESVRELLFNAVKHSHAGSVNVNLHCTEDGQIRITVRDDGSGFDPSQLKVGESGNGFGLFSIRERLGLMGGQMEIDSFPGRGSRFTLTAPVGEIFEPEPPSVLVTGDATDSQAVHKTLSKLGSPIRLLLADDHAVMREGLVHLLSRQPDIEILGEATNGQEAVELAARVRPDVILMDVSLPKLNGVEATRAIGRDHPEIRIIGLSMFEEKDRAQAMLEAGAVAYLTKTGPSSDVINAIRNCMVR